MVLSEGRSIQRSGAEKDALLSCGVKTNEKLEILT